MSTSIEKKQDAPQSRNVVMVTYPDAHILDVVGPIEILTGTKLFVEQTIDPYNVTIVSDVAGAVSTTCGITIEAQEGFSTARNSDKPIDTLVIAGGHGTQVAIENSELMSYVAWASRRAKRVVSICTGAVILAELGLLDGRRATTHWFWCSMLARKFPKINVEPNALFIRDGHVWTSAGVTAGMDLCLALIEDDWGHEVALQIARYNVMYMMRPGGQTQFSAQLIAQHNADGQIGKVLDYIFANLDESLTVTELATRSFMSERSFSRKFKNETTMTPAQYVEVARLQAARVELEQTSHSVETIARKVGFLNPERMRRAFQRHIGISASDYRERFQLTNAEARPPPDK